MQKVKPEKQHRCHSYFTNVFFFFIQKVGTTEQYGNIGFQVGDTKLEIFLPKNKHIQRKLLNFENWVSFQK